MTESGKNSALPGDDDLAPAAAEPGDERPAALPPPAAPAGPAGARPDVAPRRRTAFSAWIALLLAALSLAGTAWLWLENRREERLAEDSNRALAELEARIGRSAGAIESLESDVAAFADRNDELDARISGLRRNLEQRLDDLDPLPSRLRNLETAVGALRGISSGARESWLLAEAEYYLEIANTQLELAGNAALAMEALRMADQRLVQAANPALTDVRSAIRDELAALEAMPNPDIEGMSLTLGSLARVVDSLPFAGDGDADAAANGTEEPGGLARIWASVKNAFAGLVTVTRPEERDGPVVMPDSGRLIRSNLALQLQAARLALLRGRPTLFEQSLDDAEALLRSYFDADTAQVKGALETLDEVREQMVIVRPPDISGSLALLRQHRDVSEPSP